MNNHQIASGSYDDEDDEDMVDPKDFEVSSNTQFRLSPDSTIGNNFGTQRNLSRGSQDLLPSSLHGSARTNNKDDGGVKSGTPSIRSMNNNSSTPNNAGNKQNIPLIKLERCQVYNLNSQRNDHNGATGGV